MSMLKFNIEELQEARKHLNTSHKELDQLKYNLEMIESQINDGWKGESAEAYKVLLRKNAKEVKAIMKAEKELNEYSLEIIEFMEFLDKHYPVLGTFYPFN